MTLPWLLGGLTGEWWWDPETCTLTPLVHINMVREDMVVRHPHRRVKFKLKRVKLRSMYSEAALKMIKGGR